MGPDEFGLWLRSLKLSNSHDYKLWKDASLFILTLAYVRMYRDMWVFHH